MRTRTEPVQRSRRLRKTKKTSSVRAARLRGWVAGQAYRPGEGAFLADLPLPQRGCGAPVNHAQATKAARRDVWVVLRVDGNFVDGHGSKEWPTGSAVPATLRAVN